MQGLTLSQYEGEGISHGNWLMNGKHCVDRPDSSGVIISMPLKFWSAELHSFLFHLPSTGVAMVTILWLSSSRGKKIYTDPHKGEKTNGVLYTH